MSSAAAAAAASAADASAANNSNLPPLHEGSERHALKAEEELRVEIAFAASSTASCSVTLQQGSCELWGIELAMNRPYVLTGGGYKLALFTWYGCVVDIETGGGSSGSMMEIFSYTSDETACNIAYVNTHAQLEAMRDEATIVQQQQQQQNTAAAMTEGETTATGGSNQNSDPNVASATDPTNSGNGPRVLVVGPSESGKSSLVKLLVAYAVKLGRAPLWVDLDPADNALGVPGSLAVSPVTRDTVSVESYATTGIAPPPVAMTASGTTTTPQQQQQQPQQPLMLWHGSIQQPVVDLFKLQVTALGQKVNARLRHDDWARASGLIVNTNGWIQDDGYQLLLHTVQALSINVVLVMGHDRLYSMLRSALMKTPAASSSQQEQQHTATTPPVIKVIKVPRSGGVVSRDAEYKRACRSRSMKRYFYGDLVLSPAAAATAGGKSSSAAASGKPSQDSAASGADQRVPQLTPFLLQIPLSQLTIYKLTAMNLSASLLPVAAAQSTEPVQLVPVVDSSTSSSNQDDVEQLQHSLLAVCHPRAVEAYQQSGLARDLYCQGVAGFVVVEKVLPDTDKIHLLTPCAGNLPSHTLMMAAVTGGGGGSGAGGGESSANNSNQNIMWME